MTGRPNRRGWGWIRKLPSKRYQASYVGPDLERHNAPITFTLKTDAERWLADERRLIERDSGRRRQRRRQQTAKAVTVGRVRPEGGSSTAASSRAPGNGYQALLDRHISTDDRQRCR